jgi:hypothetical protein
LTFGLLYDVLVLFLCFLNHILSSFVRLDLISSGIDWLFLFLLRPFAFPSTDLMSDRFAFVLLWVHTEFGINHFDNPFY